MVKKVENKAVVPDKAQTVDNLQAGFRSILRSYYLGIHEMGYRGTDGIEIIREALWRACLEELGEAPKLGPCDTCGKRRVFVDWGEETCVPCFGKEKK